MAKRIGSGTWRRAHVEPLESIEEDWAVGTLEASQMGRQFSLYFVCHSFDFILRMICQVVMASVSGSDGRGSGMGCRLAEPILGVADRCRPVAMPVEVVLARARPCQPEPWQRA